MFYHGGIGMSNQKIVLNGVKKCLSIVLSSLLLLFSYFVVPLVAENTEASGETVHSIYVKRTMYNPYLVQEIYLEPNTEYVFSYLYNNLPVGEVALYAGVDNSYNNYSIGSRVYSDNENRISRTFTTVSLDTANIKEGTGDNQGLILSYVGIRMKSDEKDISKDDTNYTDGKCLYGDFILYKKNDLNKTNLFKDTNFTSIGWNSSGSGVWTSLPAANSNFAALNFGRYDADKTTSEIDAPSAEIYKSTIAQKTLVLNSVAIPYFVQTVWLKPNTKYTFSYCYSKAQANGIAALKNSDGASYTISEPIYDKAQKKVSYEFTTLDSSDSNTVVGTGDKEGFVQAIVGLKFDKTDTALIGGYYADFDLSETFDDSSTEIFEDIRFYDIGTYNNGNCWHALSGNDSAASVMTKIETVSPTIFKHSYIAIAQDVEGGNISLSRTNMIEGDIVTVTVTPDEGYTLRNGSLKANGQDITMTNGVYSFVCSNEDVTVTADFDIGDSVSAIWVKRTMWFPCFVQKVFLEPETEYVFSYLYSSLPTEEVTAYTTSRESHTTIKRVSSDIENRISRIFKTVSLDTENVEVGTGDNANKLASYIGIRMPAAKTQTGTWGANDQRYIDGKCLYGGFVLYKKNDPNKTNLFADTNFASIGWNNGGSGVWTSLPAANSNFAALNFAKYEIPLKSSFFKSKVSSSAITLNSVSNSPYLVQSLWLKPNTSYTFSYYYSGESAVSPIVYKTESAKQYSISDPIYDKAWKKVSYTFNTLNGDDTDTVVGTGDKEGLVKAVVGLHFTSENSSLVGTHYSGLCVYETADINKTNVLSDPKFYDLGSLNGDNIWHCLSENVNVGTSFARNTSLEDSTFKHSYTISTEALENGNVLSSVSKAVAGDKIKITGIPGKDYWFMGVKISDGTVVTGMGDSCVITMPSQDITLTGIFKEVLYGDCNNDDSVDIRDLIREKKYFSDDTNGIVVANSDMNEDGALDTEDIVLLYKRLLGLLFTPDMFPYTGGVINTSGMTGGADAEASRLRNDILTSIDNLNITGKTYYFSENGNDSNDGLSPSKPKKTIAELEKLSLSSGDGVLFKRGDTFRIKKNYKCISGVSYGAYGSGDKPKIYGSERDYADATLWEETKYKNIWKLQLSKIDTVYADVGMIAFNGGEQLGTKQKRVKTLINNGYFAYDTVEQAVYLYLQSGNPGDVYDNIEIGRRTGIFSVADDVTIDNLCLKYTGGHAISGGGGVSRVTVTDCELGWIGGSTHYDTRYGNGIEFYNGCDDILIKNCWIYQIFDAGITFQGDDETAEYRNITFENNLLEFCSWSIEWWSGWEKPFIYAMHQCDIAPIENISFDSNIMRFEGFGWSNTTRSPAHIHGPWNVRTYTNLKNFTVTNNIFDSAYGETVKWVQASKPVPAQTGYSMTGNSYYKISTDDDMAFYLGSEGAKYAQNQAELEVAVKLFDTAPNVIKWISK